MSTGSDISAPFAEIALRAAQNLSNDLGLLETGLDSLCLAIVVVRLEDRFGLDPFSADEEINFPVTVGDFSCLYEHAAY